MTLRMRLERLANVQRGEVPGLLASMAFFFCVLSALMVIRPAREALGVQSGLDTVRLLFIGTAVVTLAVNPVFGFLVARFRRLRFISATYLFFAASLLVFWALLQFAPQATGEISGRVFYVWFSVFNLFSTMVFWALMVDRFSLEQSKRLFGIVAVGGTLGAIFGPWFAWNFVDVVGTANLILIAVGFLVLAVGMATVVARLQPESLSEVNASDPDAPPVVREAEVIGGSAWEGFRAVVRSPYLLGICGFVLIMAIMATFIYFTRLQVVADMAQDMDRRTGLFAQIDFWTQVTTLALQLSITGHIMRRLGVGVALVLLPLTVSLGFIGLAISGTFTALILLEAAYRAVQRGITRPARETLFTVVGREDKYKSKAVVDTFVYRTGDVVGAWTEGLLGRLGGGLTALTFAILPLAAAWAVLGLWLARQQARRKPAAARTR
ncbi:MAG: MFS transporter [Gammaproteobacteria bacterium]|nr:MFS transporter [Gammaproteobacteria bacterium]TVQ46560.1 MAG: MFS transporter [Gammaproteobacteria bacterium]